MHHLKNLTSHLKPSRALPVVCIIWSEDYCHKQIVFTIYMPGTCGNVGGSLGMGHRTRLHTN